jgi:tetratricopeptide (TPR) repeat protein
MNTIFADFNARTEAGHVRLNCSGSQVDIRARGLQPGDWAWLSDSEIIFGAQLALDDRYGLVGVLDWDTLVHLDDEDDRDPTRIQAELRDLLQKPARTTDEEVRVFQLLTLFEHFSVPEARSARRPGYFAFRRAGTLLLLGKPELALIEIEEARRIDPGQPNDDHLFLEVLRRIDLLRARREAEALAASTQVPAVVLAECINVLATHADDLPEDQFRPVAERILVWADRFDQAAGREQVPALTLALIQFNRGMALLRLGRTEDARDALNLACSVDPFLSEVEEAARITAYDQHARDLAARVRARAIAA